ncbi:P1 family peptidase [Halobacillus sp. BBL2006]|uniref:P1 family peptidase n=1 Tax=Halobacillus sp. BBL2006 TaxID=1543706 RepID=UPI0005442131|nr:P1 family peptidase [Halobacillus sp. BBL2006]KHE71179.1 peptidase [Halobacillus sp. BBL2006]
MKIIPVTEIEGFRIGQSTNSKAGTGCTVILCENGAVTGVDVRGGSPGTRETDLLKSENLVNQIHGCFLSGGSAFGLDVGAGIMNFLEEREIGFDVSVAKVPIVPGAILFDLMVGESKARPDGKMGYEACVDAYRKHLFQDGNYGAGTGASIGKALGPAHAMKGGIGSFAVQIGSLKVGAIIAVNSFGDVIDPTTGQVIAGIQEDKKLLSTEEVLINQIHDSQTNRFSGNTTIGTILTNASLDKSTANKLASISQDGLARTIRPSHTFVDGDTLFTMTTNEVEVDLNGLGLISAYVVEKAVIRAVKAAEAAFGLISANDIH